MKEELKYIGKASNLPFEQIWSYKTLKDCEPILDLLALLTDKTMIGTGCRIKCVKHYYSFKTTVFHTSGKVIANSDESPGNALIKLSGSDNLSDYSYQQLKNMYRGENTILECSIENHDCPRIVDCPICKGTGKCVSCHGKKKIKCTVCDGEKSCPSCEGTGRYKCNYCDTTGYCPDCNGYGTEDCERCDGEGEFECRTCNGFHNCPDCNGTGDYNNGHRTVRCRRCNGTGECPSCDGGKKHFYCSACDDDGNVSCSGCNGTGKCRSCGGFGNVWCKSCQGSGVCGKCHGTSRIKCPDCKATGDCTVCKATGEVACPRCNGLGKYQTYKTFSIKESTKQDIYSLISCNTTNLQLIEGQLLFEDTIYEIFRHQLLVNAYEDSCNHMDDEYLDNYKYWLDLNKWCSNDTTNESYLLVKGLNIRIPITAIEIVAGNNTFTVYIMGTNNTVFCDKLPSFFNRIIGRMKNLFK